MRTISPRWKRVRAAVPIIMLVVLFTGLGFALGGLAGIISLGVLSLAGPARDMYQALPLGAFPGAVVGLISGLVFVSISERRAKRAAAR